MRASLRLTFLLAFLLRNMLSQCRRWKKCHSTYFLSLLSKSESWLEKVSNDGDFLEMKGLNVIITHKLLFAYFGPTGWKLKGAKTNMIFTICKFCCKFSCFLLCHLMFLLDFTSYGAHSDLSSIKPIVHFDGSHKLLDCSIIEFKRGGKDEKWRQLMFISCLDAKSIFIFSLWPCCL